VATLARNEALPAATLGAAVEALGVMTEGSERGLSLFFAALESEEPLIVRGGARGLQHARIMSEKVVAQYVKLLGSKQEALRIVGMQGLAAMSPVPPAAVEALASRVGEEQGREATQALIGALSASGESAMPALLTIVKRENVNRRIIAALALSAMGLRGAHAMVKAAQEDQSSEMLAVLVGVFTEVGSDAAPLVPTLAELLETSTNQEMLVACVQCIYCTQTKDPIAVRGLVGALLYAPDAIVDFAERALRNIGPAAVPTLKQALQEEPGGRMDRVSQLLGELTSQPRAATELSVSPLVRSCQALAPEFVRFTTFKNEQALMTFVYAARAWVEHGPISLRKIALMLEQRQRDRQVVPGYALSRRTVYDHIQAVRDWSEEKLVTYEERIAGGLTDAGKTLWQQLESYFEAKYGHRLK
jgi:HEAT repeat protein